jgi:hypothetical protein
MAQEVKEKKWIHDKKTDRTTRLSFMNVVFVFVRRIHDGCRRLRLYGKYSR